MARNFKKLNLTWPDWASLALGAWLFVSPWVLGFTGVELAQWNAMILGAVVVIVTIGALMEWHVWEEWIGMGAGVWLIVSPWVLAFAAFRGDGAAIAATLDTILVGAGILALSAWSVWRHRDPGLGAH